MAVKVMMDVQSRSKDEKKHWERSGLRLNLITKTVRTDGVTGEHFLIRDVLTTYTEGTEGGASDRTISKRSQLSIYDSIATKAEQDAKDDLQPSNQSILITTSYSTDVADLFAIDLAITLTPNTKVRCIYPSHLSMDKQHALLTDKMFMYSSISTVILFGLNINSFRGALDFQTKLLSHNKFCGNVITVFSGCTPDKAINSYLLTNYGHGFFVNA